MVLARTLALLLAMAPLLELLFHRHSAKPLLLLLVWRPLEETVILHALIRSLVAPLRSTLRCNRTKTSPHHRSFSLLDVHFWLPSHALARAPPPAAAPAPARAIPAFAKGAPAPALSSSSFSRPSPMPSQAQPSHASVNHAPVLHNLTGRGGGRVIRGPARPFHRTISFFLRCSS